MSGLFVTPSQNAHGSLNILKQSVTDTICHRMQMGMLNLSEYYVLKGTNFV